MIFVDRCANKLADANNINGEEREILRYGLAVIYINLSKTAILILLAALIGILKETAVLFCVYAAVRRGPRKKMCKQYLTNLDKAKITGISLT